MKTLCPEEARRMMAQGAVLVDIRDASERAREFIPGSRHVPLDSLEASGLPWRIEETVIFYCGSGNRTRLRSAMLESTVSAAGMHERGRAACYIMEGGLEAWKRNKYEVQRDPAQPMELQRQVHLGAGALILLGVILGALVHPGFYGLAAFVGAGLVVAGLTGFCGMARLLMKAPWNRRHLSDSLGASN